MSKPRILVARAIFPETIARLSQHFEVQANQDDVIWTAEELAQQLADKDGAFTTGSQRIDAALLAACPKLKIVANMAVGYNNFDVAALTAAGVQGTNTPDVLTETTADFGFALLMATARRMAESEHYLRAGQWQQWRYDMFAGAEVHGSTLGIIGMGRIGQGIARRGAHGFGMNVIYHNRSRLSPELEAECKARYRGAPHHRRGRAGPDEAHGHAGEHCARRHRRRCCPGASAARTAHCGRRPRCVRGRARRAPRSAHRAQCGAHAAHRQRHGAYTPCHGRAGG
jgi:hypothetical protein